MLQRLLFLALGLPVLQSCVPTQRSAIGTTPAADTAMLMQPGISGELARHRATTLSDVEYDLALDLRDADSAAGEVVLRVERASEAGDLVVDFRGTSLDSVVANDSAVTDYIWRDGHIRIPERHLRTGRNELRFRFATPIAASATSIIRFDEPGGDERYLYTLLVPSDAHQLFPSFDQPDLKAVFRTELTVPEGWRVLANGPLENRTPVANGVRWRFGPTEPISTYLAAFAAGPWETTEAAPAGDRPITLYARASRHAEVDADTQIALNREALHWLEDYFGIAYPFAKYDLLLAPAFPFGGMEHPGAVFYNENRFIFREEPTLNERLGRAATIRHEVAHQWFGDLVTMEWFDDLWLKEGFSTYMAAKMQDALEPGTGAWKTFYMRNKPLAYGVDVTAGTTPVWQELPNLELAKSNYGPIVYNKAPGILKQLNFLVGEEAFRAGVRSFLERHAYGNATWRDLLDALEESSGIELDRWGEQYILRAGMPMIEPVLDTRDRQIERLALVQRPARELPGDRGGWWPGKVQVRLGYADRDDVVLPVSFLGDTTLVAAAEGLPVPDYVFPNEGDYGYGLFLLDERSAEYLIREVGELEDDLLRAMVWGALWDEVREARLDPAAYLGAVLRELPQEEDEQIAGFLLGRSRVALERYLSPERARPLLARFEQLLLARVTNEDLPYGMRKASLDALIATAHTPEMQAILREYLTAERQFAGEPLKPPSRWGIITTLLALGNPAADSLLAAEQRQDTTPEAERLGFVAGAAVPTAENKTEYFRRYLDDPELNEEWVTASLDAFNHPEHAELSLEFVRHALERLEWIRDNRRIFFLPRWINAFLDGQSSAEALAMVDEFLAENPNLPIDLRRKVLQARDDLERTVRIRAGG